MKNHPSIASLDALEAFYGGKMVDACRVHVLADNNCLSFLILSVYFQYSLSPHFGLLQNGQCEARDLVVHKESNHLCECNDSTKVAFPLRVVFLLPVYFYFFMHRNIT